MLNPSPTLKRTPLRRKSTLKKKSKQKISLLQRKLWQVVRSVALIIFANKDGSVDCYTCPAKNLQGANRQLGHMWAKASLGAFLKYSFKVLRWQCARCNLFLGGQGAIFYKRMLEEIGPEEMKKLEADRNVLVRAYEHYESLLALYTEKLKNL